ncbi:MAG: site-specific integrase [Acutalibacter sp.]|nr:site-specific integrase [Acutalibacter sp.]
MELRRLAESTQGNYERVLRLFLKHSGKEVEELNEQDVRAYSLSLVKQGLQASTFNVHQAAIRFFLCRYAEQGNELPTDAPGQKGKALPEILSREEIALLLERCGNLKHKVIFALAYGSGLRRSEICRLKVQGIDFIAFEKVQRPHYRSDNMVIARRSSLLPYTKSIKHMEKYKSNIIPAF